MAKHTLKSMFVKNMFVFLFKKYSLKYVWPFFNILHETINQFRTYVYLYFNNFRYPAAIV